MSWSGVKKQTNYANIEAWCEEMGIERYTITPQGEIDVNGDVSFTNCNIKELPFKFGTITGFFSLTSNPNLISLKNCPNIVGGWFSCDDCGKLDSLEGCPKEIGQSFYCGGCKREFAEREIRSLCKVRRRVKGDITYK